MTEDTTEIGALAAYGDRACAAGDIAALFDLARVLAERVPEPLHCELIALAESRPDPVRAVAAWRALVDRLYR